MNRSSSFQHPLTRLLYDPNIIYRHPPGRHFLVFLPVDRLVFMDYATTTMNCGTPPSHIPPVV